MPDPVEGFSDPAVVATYAAAPVLQGAEEYLFARHVADGSAVLDLGVGAGRTTFYLQPRASHYVGLDYAKPMVDAARARFPEADLRHMDAADLSVFADNEFDVVVFSFNGLGYVLPDAARMRCLAECRRVLKASGVFIFSLHNPRGFLFRPGRRGPGKWGVIRGVLSGLLDAAGRLAKRLPQRSFWIGHGVNAVSAAEGYRDYSAIPAAVVRELALHGFQLRDVVPEDYPRRAWWFSTRWYYYAFAAIEADK